MITKSVIESGIYGLAVADALGVPYEFKRRADIAVSPCVGMIGNGTHGQPAGTWSDDTSLTIALADGLTAAELGDYSCVMDRFIAWYDEGEYSADGVFEVGGTCAAAFMRYERGDAPVMCGGRGTYDNGNGSLMRILPAALYSIALRGGIDRKFIAEISALTHGHDISVAACQIYSAVALAILQGKPPRESVTEAARVYGGGLPEFDRLCDDGFFGLDESEIKSSGYVVHTLEAALWCLCGTSSYEHCVLRAVNLGEDTDTVAAVAGSLAGLLYGKQAIPAEWINALRGKNILDAVIDRFANKLIGNS